MSNPTHAKYDSSERYWDLDGEDKAMWNHRKSPPYPYQSPHTVFSAVSQTNASSMLQQWYSMLKIPLFLNY